MVKDAMTPPQRSLHKCGNSLYSGWKQGSRMPVPTARPRMKVKACFQLHKVTEPSREAPRFLWWGRGTGQGAVSPEVSSDTLSHLRLRELWVWT